jgi:hypothetical protein
LISMRERGGRIAFSLALGHGEELAGFASPSLPRHVAVMIRFVARAQT